MSKVILDLYYGNIEPQAMNTELSGKLKSKLNELVRLEEKLESQLSPEAKSRISAAGLTERHARALLRLPAEERENALDKIIAEGLSLYQTEELINSILNPDQIKTPTQNTSTEEIIKPIRKAAIGDIKLFSNSLSKLICTMQNAGITANSKKSETENYIEYKVRIFKNKTQPSESIQLKIC